MKISFEKSPEDAQAWAVLIFLSVSMGLMGLAIWVSVGVIKHLLTFASNLF